MALATHEEMRGTERGKIHSQTKLLYVAMEVCDSSQCCTVLYAHWYSRRANDGTQWPLQANGGLAGKTRERGTESEALCALLPFDGRLPPSALSPGQIRTRRLNLHPSLSRKQPAQSRFEAVLVFRSLSSAVPFSNPPSTICGRRHLC